MNWVLNIRNHLVAYLRKKLTFPLWNLDNRLIRQTGQEKPLPLQGFAKMGNRSAKLSIWNSIIHLCKIEHLCF